MEPQHRRAVQSRLAELLGLKLERLPPDRTLAELAIDPRRRQAAVARLLKELEVAVDPRKLAAARTVNHLVTLVSEAVGFAGQPAVDTEPAAAPAGTAPARRPQGETYESRIPYEAERIRAAAIYCSDGRIGDHVDDFLHNGLGLPRYDRLACPGGPVALAGRLGSFWECQSVGEQLRFLLRVHEVKQVVLIAHQPCAYYLERLGIPEADLEAEQRRDLQHAAWAVQRADPALEVAGFVSWAEGQATRFERVLATPALEQRAREWRGAPGPAVSGVP
jgi:hypothetical protein